MRKWIQIPGTHNLINISSAFKIETTEVGGGTYDLYAYFINDKGIYNEYLGSFFSLDSVIDALKVIAKELQHSDELFHFYYGEINKVLH